MRRPVTGPSLWLFLIALGASAFFYQAGGWNQNSRLDLTRALVEYQSLQIDDYVVNTGDVAQKDRRFYTDKAPAMSFLAVPPLAAVRLLHGEELRDDPLAWAAWLCTLFVVGVPSALAVVALFRLGRRTGLSDRASAGAALAWGLGTLAWPYATLFYGHQLAASLLVISFAALVALRRDPAIAGRRRTLWLLGVGVLLGLGVAVEYPTALGALVLGGYVLATLGVRAALLVAAGAILPGALLAAYHTAAFGGPATLAYEFSTQPHRHMGFFMGLGVPVLSVVRALLVGEYRGLLPLMPWLVAALPGAVILWRVKARAEVVVAVSIAFLYLWLNASLVDWQGGWACGPRYLVPALPFAVWLAAGVFVAGGPVAARPRLGRGLGVLAATLVVASAFVMLVATSVHAETPAQVLRPFSNYLLPRFRAGELMVSTQSVDMFVAAPRGPRAAWTLGGRLGLTGRTQLAPLGVWFALTGMGLVFALRRGDARRAAP